MQITKKRRENQGRSLRTRTVKDRPFLFDTFSWRVRSTKNRPCKNRPWEQEQERTVSLALMFLAGVLRKIAKDRS